MRRREALALLLALPVAKSALWSSTVAAASPEPVRRILRTASGRVDVVPLDDYIAAVLPSEIGGGAPASALEAQAVAARSYALAQARRHVSDGADLCDGIHCQVYRGPGFSTPGSRRATAATRGLVLVQEGRIIAAPFHACCGGRTTRPSNVWEDSELPEIESVEDDACHGANGASWSFVLQRAWVPKLGAALSMPRARFLEVYGHDSDGRVSEVRLAAPGGGARVIRAFEFRRAASAIWGWSSVRSTAFQIEETQTAYRLSGRGTGHGAGMCQEGAIARAHRGETRDQILGRYYLGAQLAALAS